MKPLVKETLILLNIIAQHQKNQNLWSKVRLAIGIFLLLAIDTELLLELILHWKGLDSVLELAVFLAFYQASFRAFTLIVNRHRFVTLLNMLESFWTPNQYRNDVNDGEVETDAKVTYRIVGKLLQFIFIVDIICLILFYGVLPMQRMLVLKYYHLTALTKSPDCEIGVLMSFFGGGFAILEMLGFDSMQAGIMVHVIYELKIIKQKLRTLPINLEVNGDDEGCLKELALLLDRHNFVLRFIKEMIKSYSIMLLNQFLTSMLSFAAILVAITTNWEKVSIAQYLLYGVYVLGYSSQLYFYSLGGSFLTNECESVSYAVYECQWWSKTQPKLRKSIALIIQRAQKLETLSAGGFFPVNLNSFTNVINTAGSFFSVMFAAYRSRGED